VKQPGSIDVPVQRRRQSGSYLKAVRSFYSRPLAWVAMLAVSATLAFVGGGLMYWLHAVYRAEQGPAIAHGQHWLLDSTLGFVALTPVVFILLPAVLWALGNGSGHLRGRRLALFVATVGTLFALVTGPGPFLHNTLVGAGTPLADAATSLFGHDPAIAAHHEHAVEQSALSSGILQVAVGVPAYSLLTLSSIVAVRAVTRIRRRDADGRPSALHGNEVAVGS
jgi:hypothetical protein